MEELNEPMEVIHEPMKTKPGDHHTACQIILSLLYLPGQI